MQITFENTTQISSTKIGLRNIGVLFTVACQKQNICISVINFDYLTNVNVLVIYGCNKVINVWHNEILSFLGLHTGFYQIDQSPTFTCGVLLEGSLKIAGVSLRDLVGCMR